MERSSAFRDSGIFCPSAWDVEVGSPYCLLTGTVQKAAATKPVKGHHLTPDKTNTAASLVLSEGDSLQKGGVACCSSVRTSLMRDCKSSTVSVPCPA